MQIYDIAVVGGGPAGIMASIRAAELGKRVILIERNDSIGRKLLLTGGTRCNFTNVASLDTFIDKFGKQGNFLRPAFSKFFNQDLISFFQSHGLTSKLEDNGKVFPAANSARSVVDVLDKCLSAAKVAIFYEARLEDIESDKGFFRLRLGNKKSVEAKRVILATGGASYKSTGSTGDGFRIAQKLGHTVIKIMPALVPLETAEAWVKELQGLSLKARLVFEGGKRKIVSGEGEILFTHFGVSGPLVLDLSGAVAPLLEEHKKVRLFVDLKPDLKSEGLEKKLLDAFRRDGDKKIKNVLRLFLPPKLIAVFLHLLSLDPNKTTSQVTQKERRSIVNLTKSLPLTVIGSLPLEAAMVTAGGISTKEINPRTMESGLIPGLYFAGEIIEGCAPSGGYNLQQAFSTGYLAGENSAG
ncbi:MAG: NAD(P)/FAD-dependent oxidoreductase [Candidatus Omnitrophica bacterium]|nr:NAD(P)/FAD-dependent oxidoreductase [Candidatus Omnitrophota bacterium]